MFLYFKKVGLSTRCIPSKFPCLVCINESDNVNLHNGSKNKVCNKFVSMYVVHFPSKIICSPLLFHIFVIHWIYACRKDDKLKYLRLVLRQGYRSQKYSHFLLTHNHDDVAFLMRWEDKIANAICGKLIIMNLLVCWDSFRLIM